MPVADLIRLLRFVPMRLMPAAPPAKSVSVEAFQLRGDRRPFLPMVAALTNRSSGEHLRCC